MKIPKQYPGLISPLKKKKKKKWVLQKLPHKLHVQDQFQDIAVYTQMKMTSKV